VTPTTKRRIERRRDRAAAIVVVAGHILLIRRFRRPFGEYYVTPGGGVESKETPRQAVIRELREETGLSIRVQRQLFYGHTPHGARHFYFLARAPFLPVTLSPGAEESQEKRIRQRGTVEPVWMPLKKIRSIKLLPPKIQQLIILALRYGFPKKAVLLPRLWHGRRVVK